MIRDADLYPGVRMTVACTMARADVSFHVDVSVGDPIDPAPQRVAVPKMLEGELHDLGCPLTMVPAEKIVIAVGRGVANTRWRDFGDPHVLFRRHDVVGWNWQPPWPPWQPTARSPSSPSPSCWLMTASRPRPGTRSGDAGTAARSSRSASRTSSALGHVIAFATRRLPGRQRPEPPGSTARDPAKTRTARASARVSWSHSSHRNAGTGR